MSHKNVVEPVDSTSGSKKKKKKKKTTTTTTTTTTKKKKKSRQQTKTERRPSTCVGIDPHKKTLQVEVQDSRGNVMYNKKIGNTALSIRREFA